MARRSATKTRRRCCECRRWYTPAPSAAKTQKTCSKECRLGRRARQERERRKADLADARADERERQRAHRAGKRGASPGVDPPVSLTGLSLQVRVVIAEMEREVGQAYRLSLTGLRRRLRRKALKTVEKMEGEAREYGT